jgi:Tat protein translocase TatB subunit
MIVPAKNMRQCERIAANLRRQYDERMNFGFSEMVFLFLLALIIFGPKRMPEIGRQIGKALNEFKRASNEFKSQIESEINQLDEQNKQQILPPAEPPYGAIAVSAPQPEILAPEHPQEEEPAPPAEVNIPHA